jgi:hypothetical protein
MASPIPAVGLGLRATAVPYKASGNRAYLDVFVEVAGSDLSFTQSGGTFNDVLTLTITPFDKAGKPATPKPDVTNVELTLKPDTHTRVAGSGVRVWKRFEVPAGQRYQVKVAAKDSGQARTGSASLDVDVPDFGRARLSMSGVALAATADASLATFANPFEGSLPAAPTTLREFRSGGQLAAWAEVYTNRPTPAHRIDLATTVRADDGRVVFSDRDERSTAELKGASGGLGHMVLIPLEGWEPGLYVLRIEAAPGLAGVEPVFRDIQFSVR